MKKEKHPNRVAAGKKLADYNKKKKQEINKIEKVSKPKEKKEPIETSSDSWANNYWIYGVVGVGVVFLFYNSFKNGMKQEHSKAPEQRIYRPEVSFDME